MYQPVSTILGRFMDNTGDGLLENGKETFNDSVLPYLSAPSVMNLVLGGGILGNLLQVFLTNQGLNSIAVGASLGKEWLPDWEIPMTDWLPGVETPITIHEAMDWAIE